MGLKSPAGRFPNPTQALKGLSGTIDMEGSEDVQAGVSLIAW